MHIPARGEIWHIDLNPTRGKEQQGASPILAVSPREFNQLGLILACPITQGGLTPRFAGFAVTLIGTGLQTQGIVMCNQMRTVDYAARGAKFIEKVPQYIMDDVLARAQTLLS